MASSAGDWPVRPYASFEAEVSQSDEELVDEIQLQEILLESLQGTAENTPARRDELKNAIKSLKRQLKYLRNQRGLDRSASSKMNEPLNSGPSIMETIDLTNSGPSSPSVSSGLASNSINSTSTVVQKPEGTMRDRKRTYSKHLDAEDPFLPDNKSRRTTPVYDNSNSFTPLANFLGVGNTSSTIDLSEDEDGELFWMKQQREATERMRLRKEVEADDAWFARQLQDSFDGADLPAEAYTPVDTFGAQTMQSGSNIPNWIQSRASLYPQSDEAMPSFLSPNTHRTLSASIPSHIKAEQPWSFPASHNEAHSWLGSSSVAGSSRMPGTFDSFDGLFGDESSAGNAVYGGFTDTESPAADSDLEITRVVPFTSVHQALTNGSRPGTLMNGHAGILNNGSSTAGNSLSAIINRTSGYNFTTGLDYEGNPIPEESLNFLRDLELDNGLASGSSVTTDDIQHLLANIPGDGGVDNQAETPEGFKHPLYLHQKIALKWMQGMEADEKKRGGILADDMGLGKTISTLALVLTRPATPLSGSHYPHPTLIVAPVSLIRQWEREAKTKIEPGRHQLAVLNAHDPSARNKSYAHFQEFDVVLTTYDKLSREAAKLDEYVKTQASKGEPVNDSYISKKFPFMGPRSMFHRVVLDEAQHIKNPKAQRFKAVRRIQATHRWCLTGTPMMNGVEELASLISFLRIKPYNDVATFRHAFANLSTKGGRKWGQETAMKKLQALLKAVMLRRTKQSEINGQPIVQLKPKTETIDHVVFDGEEENYYRSLEKESQVKISRFLKEGLVGKHYTVALVLLLRLRQACCHPYLHITDLEFVNNDTPIKDMLANATKLKDDATQRIVNRIMNAEPFECPICYEPTENPSILLCGHNTCIDCLLKLRQNAEAQNIQAGNEAAGAKSTCPECREPIDLSVYITFDIFRQVHMKAQWEADKAAVESAHGSADDGGDTDNETSDDDDDDDDNNDETVSEDDSEVDNRGNLKDFIVNDDGDSDSSTVKTTKRDGDRNVKKHRKSKRKGKAKEEQIQPHELGKLRKEGGKNAIARKRYLNYLGRIWLDSAKVTKCNEIIAGIQESGEKTIVFSQWTLLLDLLEVKISKDLKLGYRRYDGAMSSAQRDTAITDFTWDDDVKVMLISLKAGNAGLNLTMASHVIIMDPFWNPFIEHQAVDRAHRIGQTKEVKVHRVLVQNTVEDRIVELQERKRLLVNAALDENAAQAIGRLSFKDLAYLFGVSG